MDIFYDALQETMNPISKVLNLQWAIQMQLLKKSHKTNTYGTFGLGSQIKKDDFVYSPAKRNI